MTALRTARTPEHRAANMAVRVGLGVFLLLLVAVGAAGAAGWQYVQSQKLPALDPRGAIAFQNTQILAANKSVLFDMVDQGANTGSRILKPLELNSHNRKQCPNGRRTREKRFFAHGLPILTCDGSGIPATLRDATIATEDPTFYSNPGFDPLSIARAAYQDLTSGQIQSGASTITQQFVKEYILKDTSPTISRKLKEIILAWRMTQKYSKNFILYLYLNSVYYGQLAYSVESAAQTYFHVNVAHVKLWQAAMIAGIPQSPGVYDPFNSSLADEGKSPAWYSRMSQVLTYMQARGYITMADLRRAERSARQYKFRQTVARIRQLDFVNYVVSQFQTMDNPNSSRSLFDPYLFKRLHGLTLNSGLRIITTLNPALQHMAQQVVTSTVAANDIPYHVTDGALVSISVRKGCYGCIMAMVGSAKVDPKSRLINMADSPRQPGSSIKVFNYVSAFEKGLSPSTTVLDAPIAIPDPSSPTGYYSPLNYDLAFHGVRTLRQALANSFNIPAVKVEAFNGVNRVANTAVKFGVSDFWRDNPTCCGYALTLGGIPGGMRLVQETGAYGAFATQGIKVTPISFKRIVDRATGKVLWAASKDPWLRKQRVRVAPAADTAMITSILSDNVARTPEFGAYSPLLLDRPAAAKTGTTSNFKDNWTEGYTPQFVTGVWVGNADDTAMSGTYGNSTGITGAAPIWHDFMENAFQILHLPVENFTTPPTLQISSSCLNPYTGGIGYFLPDWTEIGTTPYCTVPAAAGIQPTQETTPASSTPVPVVVPTTAPPPPSGGLLPGSQNNQPPPSSNNPPGLLPGN
ncbi:MAG TPA: transglycosylase domain-containing protein [Chloroflexota bacterium]|nr:transglycosylase domain-containing protein [Chloroflexota bacterium]